MKKAFAAFVMLLLFSCKKEDALLVHGDYSGDIEVWVNNTKQAVLKGHVISINLTADENKVTLSQNVMTSSTAELSGNRITIPRATVGTGPDMMVVEYGSGSFEGNRLTIEFFQELKAAGMLRTTRWTGTLHRK